MKNCLKNIETFRKEKEKLKKTEIKNLNQLEIPNNLSNEAKGKILKGVWGLALSDGLVTSEKKNV